MNIYDQALQATKENKVNAKLYTGTRKNVYLSTRNDELFLTYQELDDRKLVKRIEVVRCGFYSLRYGWVFSLDRDSYERWVAKTGHIGKKSIQPLSEWAKTPGGKEYMDQPVDKDLAQEWSDHNAARVAPRHPGQQRLDGWRRRPTQ